MPHVEWVWDQLAAPGFLTLVSGRPKAGKSTLLFGLCAALRTGQPFLGMPTRPTKTIYCTEERWSSYDSKAKLFGDPDYLYLYEHKAGLDLAGLCEALAHDAADYGAGLVIIDTWTKWARFGSGSLNDADSVRVQMGHLEHLASTVAVMAVGYQRKGEGEFGEGVMGSTEIVGRADVIMELRRKDDERLLEIIGRTDAPERILFQLDHETGTLRAETPEDRVFKIVERLAGESMDAPSGNMIEKAMHARHGSLRPVLDSLVSQSRLRVVGAGNRAGYVPAFPPFGEGNGGNR